MNRQNLCPPELLSMDNAMEDFWREYRTKTVRAESRFGECGELPLGANAAATDAMEHRRTTPPLSNEHSPKQKSIWPGFLICAVLFGAAVWVYLQMAMEATQ